MHWILLAIGIAIEIAATTSLKFSDGFSKWHFAGLALIGFALAFYVMSLVIRTMPVGIAYAVWAGGGIAGVTILGALVFDQRIGSFGYLGIGLIMAGVVVLNTLSASGSG